MGTIAYRPEVDGLRAFAVIPVILFHMGFRFLAGGYIGVDVFFVISGFLITALLKNDLESGSFSFAGFWARRIRRILPALLFVIAVSLGYFSLFGFRPERSVIAKQAAAAILSFANIYYWRVAGDYWGPEAEDSPFLHTWSLSVEEQFYLGFPLVVFILFRVRPKWLPGLMLTVLVISLSLFLWGSVAHPRSTFYLLPTRAWELAAGACLAVVPREANARDEIRASLAPLALAGLGLIVASYLFVPKLNGGVAVAVLGAALVIAFGQSGLCRAILGHRSAVHFGRISYSLYLWHWPVLVFARQYGIDSHNLLLLPVIYGLSLASYHFVETPLRRRKGMVPAIAVCAVSVLGFCVALAFSSPFYDTTGFERPQWNGRYYDLKPRVDPVPASRKNVETMDIPSREASPDAYLNGGILVGGQEGTNPRIVVLGDSHGVMWADAIRSVTEDLGIRTSIITMNGVPPFLTLPLDREQTVRFLTSEEKYEYDKSRVELIESWKPDLTIVCCRWATSSESEASDLLKFLAQHSARTLLVEQPPELAGVGPHNALQYLIFRGLRPTEHARQSLPLGNAAAVESGRRLVRTLAKNYGRCGVIPTYDLFLENGETLVLVGNNAVYVDDDHLTTFGARLARTRIQESISEALRGAAP